MTADEIRRGVDVLRHYYARDGQPYRLNDAQWAAYLDALQPFPAAMLAAAASAWIRQSRWFPAVSDLLSLLAPAVSSEQAAHLAWTTVERALRSVGTYRSVTFEDGAIGETVRQVFGSWPAAGQFDVDSPGWAIRRQSFLALYPVVAARTAGPVTLQGRDRSAPALVAHVPGLPAPHAALSPSEPLRELSQAEAETALRGVAERALARARSESA